MKKIIALLLALSLLLSLAACGKTSEAPAATEAPKQEAAAVEAPKEETPAEPEVPEWIQKDTTPLFDARVRQALAYAIDMDTIAETFFEGKVAVAKSMTAPGDMLLEGLNDYAYNPELAKQLLAEAQYPEDYVLDVVYHYSDQQTVDLMTIIGQYWAAVGIKANFRKLEGDVNSQFGAPPVDRVNGPSGIQYDLGYGAVAALTEHDFYNRFASDASGNSTVPKQDKYIPLDEAIARTNATADVNEQKVAFQEIQKIMNDDVLCLPLYHQVAFVYTSDRLDMKGNALGNDQYTYVNNILDWEIDNAEGIMYTNGGAVEFFQMPFANPGLFIYNDLVFERLINADNNLTPTTEGLVAESFEVSDDGLTYTFKIREGSTWHDGQPLTAEDVKFTYELYLKSGVVASAAKTVLNAIEGAPAFLEGTADEITGIVVDGNTVTFTFSQIAAIAQNIFSQWPILPKHLLKDADPLTLQQNAFWQKPVGSGPYKVGDVVLGTYSTLERWDGYFKTGTGNIKTIYMFASNENDANLVKNATAGKIDYAWGKSTSDAAALEAVEGMNVHVANIKYTRLFYINQFTHIPYGS